MAGTESSPWPVNKSYKQKTINDVLSDSLENMFCRLIPPIRFVYYP